MENTKMSLEDVANDPSLFDALPSTERAALYEEVVGLDAWLKARLLTKPGPGLFEFFQGGLDQHARHPRHGRRAHGPRARGLARTPPDRSARNKIDQKKGMTHEL